ncbi:MAG: HAMP domain-containing sensor histidine kinase [Myxococcales bacterium]
MGSTLAHLADHQAHSVDLSLLRSQLDATQHLVEVAQTLSTARELSDVMAIVKHSARQLTQADGASFVLRDGDLCFYADEESIEPLWKGSRFPMRICVSGWTMLHREAAVIEDIYQDSRVPVDAYRATYVTSLAMVPIRTAHPVGAIGIYWSQHHRATDAEVTLLRALADLTSVAMENVRLYSELNRQIAETRRALESREEFISTAAHELRTPLTSLTLQVESIEAITDKADGMQLDARLPGKVSAAAASVGALNTLVNELLAATMTDRSMVLTLSEFELADAVQAVTAKLAGAARWANSPIYVTSEQPLRGSWDRELIEQALRALLSNALKFGAGCPVRVSLHRHNEFAHVEVCDEGMALVDEHSCVRRLDSMANHAGLGLGLFKAKQIADAHAGAISVASRGERGCAVSLTLPLGCEHDA